MKKIKISSNRSFGIVFCAFFLIVSLYPLINEEPIRYWSLIVSIIFLILGILDSNILSPLNKAWFKFGLFLGKIVSPVVMGIVFFGVVTPIALILKIMGKDLLNLKKSKINSYWITKTGPKSKMKNQF